MSDRPVEGLAPLLREAGPERLHELVEQHLAELDVGAVRHLMRNPFIQREHIERVLGRRQLLSHREIRIELARHPKTPEASALRLIATLFWRDLMNLAVDTAVRPTIRLAAERQLVARLPGLASGERIAIARRAGPTVVAQLRGDAEPRVVEALLENPRLTEGSLIPLVASERTDPKALTVVAHHAKWGIRHGVRWTLCRNPRTPIEVALGILPFLTKRELAELEKNARLAIPLRRRAATLLGKSS